MKFDEFNLMVAQQPMAIQIWLNVLLVGAFVLPCVLLIWRQSRIAGAVTLGCSVLAAIGVIGIFSQLGYVRLMGLGHILFWTPIAVYLFRQQARLGMPTVPIWIMRAILLVITISLIFDYVDLVRYILGDRTPLPPA
ncbi:hypothetical protein M3P21_09760 [Ruegeria sp. 2012CJ41-6]|uniref:Transmembrane protein n=1 Tax=Ruegeria spongiae TaxID=2942209 RepID=A0ABT0Q3R8_9RHOB|nr:hypothetical protein [Ruegeria spongiae]MCL6283813.1 hypothetical protein [Ruegeria spongiae]